jgi:predicted type IV restriction endonuclease
MFKIISKVNSNILDVTNTITSHSNNNYKRYEVYKYILSTNFIDCFIVDKGHPNGLEVHCINEYGLIYIYNLSSKKLITILHPRPRQIKRYYIALGLTTCEKIKHLIKVCYERNNDHYYNEV